jgi:hypothetical protein
MLVPLLSHQRPLLNAGLRNCYNLRLAPYE